MENKKIKTISHLFFSLVLLGLGFFYVRYSWEKSLENNSNQALKMASIVGSALNGEMLKQLHAVPEDLKTVAYESIKKRLIDIRNADDKIRFGYLYTQKSDKLYFIADSEPATSGDYSPPGQEYTEADSQYYAPFIDGKPLITRPVTDRWGKWVSVLIPIKNADTGNVFAVLGLDYPSQKWDDDAFKSAVQAGLSVVSFLTLFIVVLLIVEGYSGARKNEKNFRTIFEDFDDIILVCDRTGRIQYSNNAAHVKLGYGLDELQKMSLSNLNPKGKNKDAERLLGEIVSGKKNTDALPLQKKDGSLLFVATRVLLGKWNGKDCVYGIYKELSNEQQLLQKFNQIFDNNPAVMLIASFPEQIITDVNKTFVEKVGYAKEEAVGKKLSDVGIVLEKEETKIKEVLSGKSSFDDVEVKILTKSRSLVEGVCNGEIIENQGKKYLLLVVIDQASHIKSEKQLKKALTTAERLNRLMIGRELEMVELKKELARLKNMKGEK